MAPKKKKNKLLVKLVSGAGTGFFYLFKKTNAIAQRKLALRKFDPIVNQYVIFNEAKLKFSTQAHHRPTQSTSSSLLEQQKANLQAEQAKLPTFGQQIRYYMRKSIPLLFLGLAGYATCHYLSTKFGYFQTNLRNRNKPYTVVDQNDLSFQAAQPRPRESLISRLFQNPDDNYWTKEFQVAEVPHNNFSKLPDHLKAYEIKFDPEILAAMKFYHARELSDEAALYCKDRTKYYIVDDTKVEIIPDPKNPEEYFLDPVEFYKAGAHENKKKYIAYELLVRARIAAINNELGTQIDADYIIETQFPQKMPTGPKTPTNVELLGENAAVFAEACKKAGLTAPTQNV